MINAVSLFSSIGVGEYYLSDIGINVIIANEKINSRSEAHKFIYPKCKIVNGDITDVSVQQKIIDFCIDNNVKILIATPPCQGVSTIGSNRSADSIFDDERNSLVLSALSIADAINPDYFLIENVPRFEKMLFPYNNEVLSLKDLLMKKYGKDYFIETNIYNAADYGVPQTRFRIVYRAWKKDKLWISPKKEKQVNLTEAIGDLPSLEAGESSEIKNHSARPHPINHIECMRHTPTGKSAFGNDGFVPRKEDGTPIKGYGNTYKRMRWDSPAPTITMRNEIISSQENVHPGRSLPDGTWSDARVLTLRELLIVSSLPPDMDIPSNLSETSFRQLIGEGIPPLLLEKVMKGILI